MAPSRAQAARKRESAKRRQGVHRPAIEPRKTIIRVPHGSECEGNERAPPLCERMDDPASVPDPGMCEASCTGKGGPTPASALVTRAALGRIGKARSPKPMMHVQWEV